MVMATDLQARFQEVRARVDNVRPNILPGLIEKARGEGVFGGGAPARVRGILEARPIIGQAMRGTLLSGGKPNPASAQVALTQGGFRAIPPQASEVPTSPGGYRFAT